MFWLLFHPSLYTVNDLDQHHVQRQFYPDEALVDTTNLPRLTVCAPQSFKVAAIKTLIIRILNIAIIITCYIVIIITVTYITK